MAARKRKSPHVESDPKCSFSTLLADFHVVTKAPERFISPQIKAASDFTNLTKHIFDYSQHDITLTDSTTSNLNGLSQLIVDNFDDEQIWQEIELHNEPCLKKSFQAVAKVIAGKKKGGFFTKSKSRTTDVIPPDDEEEEEDDSEEEEDILEYSGSQDLFPEMQSEEDHGDAESDDEDSETNFDIDGLQTKRTRAKKSTTASSIRNTSNMRTSVVDDKFFKLSEMERFLELEDARYERRRDEEEGKGRKGQEDENDEDDDDDDDESVDLFEELPSDDDDFDDEDEDAEEEEERDLELTSAKDMKYTDFFPDPDGNHTKQKKKVQFEGMESEEEHDDDDEEDDELAEDGDEEEEPEVDEEGAEAARKALKGLLGGSDDDEGEELKDIFGGGQSEEGENKSAFEKRQDRLKGKIKALEEANLGTKPWQLSGEVTGVKRPANSLLEEDLDFDAVPKPGVEITEETTKSLEEIIHQRVLDAAWDDVERKVKPKEDPFEFKKRVTLDQEKSKQSLAEIYEQEYIKKTQGEKEDEEDPAHVEIKTMMDSLFLKLDALSNFHYTPKPAIPEVKIVSNLPSITMEEVAPVTTTDATLLAPEEIQEKSRGEVKGDTEKTETDQKQARRKKKTRQRVHAREKEKREKLMDKLNPGLGNKYTRQAAMNKLEKSSKVASSRTTIIKEGKGSKKSLTSSKAFFNQLQDAVTAEVRGVKAGKNKDKKQITSSKLKL